MKLKLLTILFLLSISFVYAKPSMDMEKIYNFLKDANTYFIATTDGDQPRVRPFGTINIYNDKLYIQTSKVKKIAQQIIKNPKIEIVALNKKGDEWIRVSAKVVEEKDIKAKISMLDAYPNLKGMYKAEDENTFVLQLKDVDATIENFSGKKEKLKF